MSAMIGNKLTVGFDVSPLSSGHKVRGIGFYTKRLTKELKKLQSKSFCLKRLKSTEEIKRENYDLLHIPYFSPFFISLPVVKKPMVVTVHDLVSVKYPAHYPPGVKGSIGWQIQKRRLKKAAGIITDSQASKRDIVRMIGLPSSKIKVIYLAADPVFKKLAKTSKRLAKVKEKYSLPEEFVLFVGDVNWNKNVPSLVEACLKLKLPLIIVGKQAVAKNFDRSHPENKDLVWLQEKAEKNNAVRLLGFVPSLDLVVLYNLAAIYCMPSFDEGFGLPILEAMACGCPVICSNKGSLPEIAGNAALVTEPMVNDLAEKIDLFWQSKKMREKYACLGQVHVRRFSWSKTAESTLQVYESLLSCAD